jgi:hypothetical protein
VARKEEFKEFRSPGVQGALVRALSVKAVADRRSCLKSDFTSDGELLKESFFMDGSVYY